MLIDALITLILKFSKNVLIHNHQGIKPHLMKLYINIKKHLHQIGTQIFFTHKMLYVIFGLIS